MYSPYGRRMTDKEERARFAERLKIHRDYDEARKWGEKESKRKQNDYKAQAKYDALPLLHPYRAQNELKYLIQSLFIGNKKKK